MISEVKLSFSQLGLSQSIIDALDDIGYTIPSPIQKECIPLLLKGYDVLGMAQTGSGKTAAFILPLLNNINILIEAPQILVLTPTRELAIQVADASVIFAKYIKKIYVIALYGGQNYEIQFRSLKRNPQIIVATPGRLLDHLKRGTINLSYLFALVLDEADEMLRMGFLEDVENILSQIPSKRQTALFSATMPSIIQRIAHRFMKSPYEINIKSNPITAPDIEQNYWFVCNGIRKSEALVRFLEIEDFDAVIIFVRTKSATLEVSEALENSGYNSAALNGDMNQSLREKTLQRLRDGRLDILIATDVASRGLDVKRVSLVINYDIPIDVASYIHRIGRTGRAGRTGKAISFVYNKEYRLLSNIKRNVKKKITEIKLPSSLSLSRRRQEKFAENIKKELKSNDLDQYRNLLNKFYDNDNLDIKTLASILLKMAQGSKPLLLPADNDKYDINNKKSNFNYQRYINLKSEKKNNKKKNIKHNHGHNTMELYRIEVGRNDGVEVRHIVGTISNEVDISSHHIGHIRLFDSHATIELPKGISNTLLHQLTQIRIFNKYMNIHLLGDANYIKKKKYLNSTSSSNNINSISVNKKKKYFSNKLKNTLL